MTARTLSWLLLSSTLLPAAVSAQQSPIRLQLPEAARLNGQAYALELSETVVIDFHGAIHNADRAVRFRFRFSGSTTEGERVKTSLAIDSLLMTLGSPHGDQLTQTHGLTGTSLLLEYSRRGGGASYVDAVPLIDFAELGGAFPLSSLVDQVFPALAREPVRVGESWEHWWVRSRIDGGAPTERRVSTRYTLEGLETKAGQTVARIGMSTHAEPTGAAAAGALEANGYVLIRPADGVVLEVASDETITGNWSFEGMELPYKQTVRLRALNTSSGAPPR